MYDVRSVKCVQTRPMDYDSEGPPIVCPQQASPGMEVVPEYHGCAVSVAKN